MLRQIPNYDVNKPYKIKFLFRPTGPRDERYEEITTVETELISGHISRIQKRHERFWKLTSAFRSYAQSTKAPTSLP